MILHLIPNTIKTVFTFCAWALITPTITLVGIPFTLLPIKYRLTNRLYYFGSWLGATLMVKTTFIKVQIKGKENLNHAHAQQSIIVCNHSSAIDIPLVQMVMGPHPHVWFSKAAYAKIPFFGFLLRRMHILVNKERTTECTRTIQQAHEFTDGLNNHIFIFPEGMRHNDGNIHRFFSGFSVMAQELNRPVIPIVIHGLNTIFPKKSKLIYSSANKVTLSIGQPIWYTVGQTRQEFTQQVRAWFINELEQMSHHS